MFTVTFRNVSAEVTQIWISPTVTKSLKVKLTKINQAYLRTQLPPTKELLSTIFRGPEATDWALSAHC